MTARRLIKDELRYLLFSEIYFKTESPKAKRKAFALLETAIECLEKNGFERFSLEMVAREASVSRATIRHYYNDSATLRDTAIKYLRLLFQKMVIDRVTKETRPDKMLSAYIDACFDWVDHFRRHANVWLSFLNFCTKRAKFRALNTEAVEVGHERIASLLAVGKSQDLFHHKDSAATAKIIQVLITGAMIVFASEDFKDRNLFRHQVRDHCLELAAGNR